jgi:peptidoglycan/xylan/chitin deacetylase (PgdA/CDA1 family)
MSKKALVAKLLFKYLRFFSYYLDQLKSNQLSILGYHRVFDYSYKNYPFYRSIISTNAEMFEQQMRFVKKNFNVINFQILQQIIDAGEKIPRGTLIITFDDGYADNYEIVFPILKKYDLTATIFTLTSSIMDGEPFWFELTKYFFDTCSPGVYTFKDETLRLEITEASRESARKEFWIYIRTIENARRENIVNKIKNGINSSLSAADLELIKPLTWQRIREMSEEGIEFGSHTISHPYLINLTADELIRELTVSKKLIEENINKAVISIAYPFGAHNEWVEEQVKKCGYRFGISYRNDVIKKLNYQDTFKLPRVHVDNEFDYFFFKARLLLPGLFLN